MSVLVFGASGQMARALARARDVVSLSRDQANLCDPAACAKIIQDRGPRIVINAAAYTGVDAAEADAELAHLINAQAPGAMARATAEIGAVFLHISTDYVFDGGGQSPWRPDDPTGPLSVYGHSKLAGEQAVVAAGGSHVVLRTSWVFSTHGSNFVKTMLGIGRERTDVRVVGDQVGGPTAAADVAATLLAMADKMAAGHGQSGIFHYSGAPDVSWADFAREIFNQAGMAVTVDEISTTDYPTPAARPANSRLDCRDLTRVYGIERPDWRRGLARVLGELG